VQEERWRGIYDVLGEKYPGIEIIDPASGRGEKEETTKQLKALLEYNPQIKGLIAGGEEDAEALGEVIAGMGKTGEISAVYFGASGGDGGAAVITPDISI
jgi:ABC-type sugar transport system substrate-binding protein